MLTDKGLARLQLAEAFGLDAFFQEQVGNIVIADWEFTDKIRQQISEHHHSPNRHFHPLSI